MRELILMRHAKAEPASGADDHGRPLSARGRAEAARAGRRLLAGRRPDLAILSDSARTRGTFEAATAGLEPPMPHAATRALYGAAPERILAEIRSVDDDVRTLLCIGHNPGIGALALLLGQDGDPESMASLARGFPTACFAVIDVGSGGWREVGAPGRLIDLLSASERGRAVSRDRGEP